MGLGKLGKCEVIERLWLVVFIVRRLNGRRVEKSTSIWVIWVFIGGVVLG